ncbi:MAG: cysteine methyltransferase [Bacillaceae bacterium G1]|nr:cysteine methyltransferase [Bacillota bacterium]OJF16711.1 MAG: cysteine methyltransferase [Bacillaceae bacterium G1]
METVVWSSFRHASWEFLIAATEKGLCCVTLPNESWETLSAFIQRHFPGAGLKRDDERMAPYAEQLTAYLAGRLKQFTVPLDVRGTPFQLAVWQVLQQIPYGRLTTYGDIAAQIGKPTASRAVGAAVGANPLPLVIPCHRVVGKDGRLTGYRGGLDVKAALLRLEGISLSEEHHC